MSSDARDGVIVVLLMALGFAITGLLGAVGIQVLEWLGLWPPAD
jgi:hypothetical protein